MLTADRYVVIACWAAYLIYWNAIRFSAKRIVRQDSAWKRVAGTVALIVIFMAATKAGLFRHRVVPASAVYGIVGAAVCLAGTILAIWARRVIGRNWSPRPAVTEAHELVTNGPYSVVRHPIYAGILLILTGTLLVVGRTAWLAMLVVALVWIYRRVLKEEALMTQIFGPAYAEYRKRTKAIIPFLL